MEEFDVVVIGAGPGGYVAAIRAAQLGFKTACVEKRKELGGTCLNVGCIPSKSLLQSSEFYHHILTEAQNHGIAIQDLSFQFEKIMKRKQSVVSGFVQGIEGLFKKNKIHHFTGLGKLLDPHTIQVGEKTLQSKNIILATGSEPIALPFLKFDEETVLSSTGALSLKKVPEKMLIVGAGIIGVELGSVYARLGTKVEFVEFLDHIIPSTDRALSKAMLKILQSQGMKFYLSHKVVSGKKTSKGIELSVESSEGSRTLSGDVVLVAIGRKPYSKDLGLEKLGIEVNEKGMVKVNDLFQTNHPNIYAIGDLINGPMLAHKASEEGIAVAEILSGKNPEVMYLSIPNVAYTYPELASVGITEEEAKKRKIEIVTSQFPFKANSRARCMGEGEGFVKMIMEKKSQRLIGVHILSVHAGELIQEAALALKLKATARDIAETSHAHPTLSESLKEAALMLFQGAIHL